MSNISKIENIIRNNILVEIKDQYTFNKLTFNFNYNCEPEDNFRENFQKYLWLVNVPEKK